MEALNNKAFVFGNNIHFRLIFWYCPSPSLECVDRNLRAITHEAVKSSWGVYIHPLQEKLQSLLIRLNEERELNIVPLPLYMKPINSPPCNLGVDCFIKSNATIDWILARMVTTPKPDGSELCVLKNDGGAVTVDNSCPMKTGKVYKVSAGRCIQTVDEISHLLRIGSVSNNKGTILEGSPVPLVHGILSKEIRTTPFSGRAVHRTVFWLWCHLRRSMDFWKGFLPILNSVDNRTFKWSNTNISVPVYMYVGLQQEKCFDIRLPTLKFIRSMGSTRFTCDLRRVIRQRLRSRKNLCAVACYRSNGRLRTHAHEIRIELSGTESLLGASASFSEIYRGTSNHGQFHRATDWTVGPETIHALCITKSLRCVIRMRSPGSPRILPHLLMRSNEPNEWDRQIYLDNTSTDNRYNRCVMGGIPSVDPLGIHMRILASSPLCVTAKMRAAPAVDIAHSLRSLDLGSAFPGLGNVCLEAQASEWVRNSPWIFGIVGTPFLRSVNEAWIQKCLGFVSLSPCKFLSGIAVMNAILTPPGRMPSIQWIKGYPRLSCAWKSTHANTRYSVRSSLEKLSLVWFRIMTLDLGADVKRTDLKETSELRLVVTVSGLDPDLKEHIQRRLSVLWCECVSWLVQSKATASTEALSSIVRASRESKFSETAAQVFDRSFGLVNGTVVQITKEGEAVAVRNPNICSAPIRHHRIRALQRNCVQHCIQDGGRCKPDLAGTFHSLSDIVSGHGGSCSVAVDKGRRIVPGVVITSG